MENSMRRNTVLDCLAKSFSALFCLAVGVFFAPETRAQYYPDHPVVQQMVEKGVAFLESKKYEADSGVWGEAPSGAGVLAGYVVLKVRQDPENPVVKSGLAAAQEILKNMNRGIGGDSKIVYEVAVAALLFCEADPEKYRPELERIRDWFVSTQKDHGGWGYLSGQSGDTSQTQYVMLALWSMNIVGVTAPTSTVEAGLRWLQQYQQPEGGWLYQNPGSNSNGVTKSLATAGLSAAIIGGDMLRLFGNTKKAQVEDLGDIPEALHLVVDEEERKPVSSSITKADLQPTIDKGVRWQVANPAPVDAGVRDWYSYWRYSQERYESFLELVKGKQDKSPAWYNQGVEHLRKLQDKDGSWGNKHQDHSPPPVATAFSILFLIRSTQKAIGKASESLLLGGYGLPKDASSLRQVGTKVIGNSAATSIDDLLSMLENDDPKAKSDSLMWDNLRLAPDRQTRRLQLARLSRVLNSKNLLGTDDYMTRRVAAKLVAQSDDLDYVPALIYALGDPDGIVAKTAYDGLRLVSRQLGKSFSETATQAEKKVAQEEWRKWYLKLRPDYIFIEE